MRSLLPGYPDNPLFEAIFIDLLPANARDAAVKHELLEDMAEAADKVLAEAPASQVVSSVAWTDPDAADLSLAQVSRPQSSSTPSARKQSPRGPPLCFIHRNYGRSAFRYASPATCSMKDAISKPTSAQGNTNAGRQ